MAKTYKQTLLAMLTAVQPMLPLYGKLIVASLIALIEKAVPDTANFGVASMTAGGAPASAWAFVTDVFAELKARYVPASYVWAVELVEKIITERFLTIAWNAVFPPTGGVAEPLVDADEDAMKAEIDNAIVRAVAA